jgi:hypothetical protein
MSEVADEQLRFLEQLVVANDQLLQLEERIGKFNVFDALNIARAEIRHSTFLAWLLDPAESHGHGGLFLRSVLMDLLGKAPPKQRPFSPVKLDGKELRGVEIRREWQHIDILIICQEPSFVLAIENKVDASEHSDQLQRYQEIVAAHFPDKRRMYVFLTRNGDDPTGEDWVGYTYSDLYAVLQRTRNAYAKSIGAEVLVFLDHYLRLVGNRFMDDSELDELCKQIYRNHRQAFDLIWDRIGEGGLILDIEEMIKAHSDRWTVTNRTSRRIEFVPTTWLPWLPPICALPKADPKSWLVLIVQVTESKCRIRVLVRPCTDVDLRRRIIERLTRASTEFGFKVAGAATDKWTTIFSTTVDQWSEGEEPDKDNLLQKIAQRLDALEQKLGNIGKVVQLVVGSADG